MSLNKKLAAGAVFKPGDNVSSVLFPMNICKHEEIDSSSLLSSGLARLVNLHRNVSLCAYSLLFQIR